MAAYSYKEVLKLLPETYIGEGFKARHFGEEYDNDCGYDGDLHNAASDYIEDAQALLRWIAENSGECIGDHPEKMATLTALLAPSGW